MNPEAFARLRPTLHHLAAADAWRGIVRWGFLSTTALLDLHGVAGEERTRLEARKRPGQHALDHPTAGRAVLRDQRPLSERALAAQLTDGWSVGDWCRHLNRHAFLFPTRAAALAFGAVYARQANDLLTFDTAAVLRAAGGDLRVCTVNSGAPTARAPTPRGPRTFERLDACASTPGRVKEVAVLGGLAEVGDSLLGVERLHVGGRAEAVWRRRDPLPPPAGGA